MAQQAAREPNPFSIDPDDELPVGLQLTWRLRALIATGRLASGERLPSFRRLSECAGVNVNTLRAVYAGLEQARETLIAQLSEAQRAAEQRAWRAGRERGQEASPLERAMNWWRHKL